MKKLLTSVLAGCFLCGILGVNGCSKKETEKTKTTEKTTTEKTTEKDK